MVEVIGLDIGGANTKLAFLRTEGNAVRTLRTFTEYFPIWRRGKENLPGVLRRLSEEAVSPVRVDGVGITMTAELSDAYQTKREGVNHILDCVEEVYGGTRIYVLDVDANLIEVEEARKEPMRVAAANWAATGWMVSQVLKNCVVVDVGSTTTSIIPIIDGRVAAAGKTDLEKLMNGELVYTGSIRTNVASIVSSIPIRGRLARVSSELFAQSGDVHLILGNITEEEYTVDTADGRGKTFLEAAARLARVVCADIEMLTEEEIVGIAEYVYERQLQQIIDGLRDVYRRVEPRSREDLPIVVTGLGRKFLAEKAARKAGFRKIIDLGELLGAGAALVSPSVGVALRVASEMEGEIVRWRPS